MGNFQDTFETGKQSLISVFLICMTVPSSLLIEIFKMKNELAPPIMGSILNKRFNTYNLRNFQEFATERKRTVWYDLEALSYRYPQLWSLLQENLKEMNSLSKFKKNIKHWLYSECP